MLLLLILSYLWAGATVVFALRFTGRPGVMVLLRLPWPLIMLWPLALPTWVFIEWREGRGQKS